MVVGTKSVQSVKSVVFLLLPTPLDVDFLAHAGLTVSDACPTAGRRMEMSLNSPTDRRSSAARAPTLRSRVTNGKTSASASCPQASACSRSN